MRRGIQYNNFWIEVYPDRIGAAVYPAMRGRYDGFWTFFDAVNFDFTVNMMSFSVILTAGIFLISLVLTMVGLGGGLIFSPLFIIFGFAKSDAAAVSLFLNLIAAGSAAFAYAGKKMVDFSLSVPLIVSSSLAAPAGAYMNVWIDPKPFLIIMSVVLALAGVRMAMSPKNEVEHAEISSRRKVFGGAAIGTVVGFIGGLLGIGGGIFIVPFLIYVLRIPTRTAAASSTFIVCFSSLTGFLGYASIWRIDWLFIVPAAAACIAGGQIGARTMSSRLKGKNIRLAFSAILFLMCARLVHRAFLEPP